MKGMGTGTAIIVLAILALVMLAILNSHGPQLSTQML